MKNKYTTKRMAVLGLLSAFAIIISYLESLIPIEIGIPGIKLGLANIVVVLTLYLLDSKSAIIINVIRIVVIGMMFGNVFSIFFSIAGAVMSYIVMILVKKIKNVSMLGVSVCGGVTHNIAQLCVAAFVVNTYNIVYYVPFMVIGGLITGIAIGITAMALYGRVQKVFRMEEES